MFTRTLSAILVAASLVSGGATTHANAGSKLENAVYKAVVKQKSTKRVRASRGHEFNIKKVSVSRTPTGYLAKGQLSHHLSFRKDDQYYYTIEINRSGVITRFDEKINRGGFTTTLLKLPVGELIKAKSKGKVDAKTSKAGIEAAGRWLGSKLDGNWEAAARKIVVVVGLQVAKSRRLGTRF